MLIILIELFPGSVKKSELVCLFFSNAFLYASVIQVFMHLLPFCPSFTLLFFGGKCLQFFPL